MQLADKNETQYLYLSLQKGRSLPLYLYLILAIYSCYLVTNIIHGQKKGKMVNRKKLKIEIDKLKKERKEMLYMRHHYGIDAEIAAMTISDIEYKIACLEDQLDFENRMINFKVTLYAFIAVAIGMFTWLFIFKN